MVTRFVLTKLTTRIVKKFEAKRVRKAKIKEKKQAIKALAAELDRVKRDLKQEEEAYAFQVCDLEGWQQLMDKKYPTFWERVIEEFIGEEN